MAPLTNKIETLKNAANLLNQKSDELGEVIADVERELNESGVGVSAWLDDYYPEQYLAQTLQQDGVSEAWLLGYDKLGGGWHLAAQRVRITHIETSDVYGGEINVDGIGDPLPLAQAARRVRAEAAAHLEALVAKLTDQATTLADNVDRAKAARDR